MASAITQIFVQGAIAGKSAAALAKKLSLQAPDKEQLAKIQSRLTRPFTQKNGPRSIDLKREIRKIADKHLWVIRNKKGLQEAITKLQSITKDEIPQRFNPDQNAGLQQRMD